jgi:hypothetical protein
VEFKEVSMRYRPGLEQVLKEFSTIIEPGSKVNTVCATQPLSTVCRNPPQPVPCLLADANTWCTLGC